MLSDKSLTLLLAMALIVGPIFGGTVAEAQC